MAVDQPAKKAIVCLSGGMDSTTLLYFALNEGYQVYPLSFDYHQRHRIELEYAAALCAGLGLSHKILEVDLSQIGGSALTDASRAVPAQSDNRQIATVVPMRNTLFCTLAAAYGEIVAANEIFYGPVLEDYNAYRDCRQEFFTALETALSLGSTHPREVKIHTPFVKFSKAQVLQLGFKLNVPYEKTHTCYQGLRPPCGVCDACRERLAAFAQVGKPDPLLPVAI